MKKLLPVLFIVLFSYCAHAQYVVFHEGFDTTSTTWLSGWTLINKSNPIGTDQWKKADGTLSAPPLAGNSNAQTSFASVNNQGTISDWLISPLIYLINGDTVSFFTISYNSHAFPDRLECRLSQTGSTNVGNNESSVGDFTSVLVAVNPNLDTMSYPSIQEQGDTWTEFRGGVSGLSGGTNCRIAFRYYITDGGQNGTNSSTIGLDSMTVISAINSAGLENTLEANISIYPNPAADILTVSLDQHTTAILRLTDMQGKILFSQPVMSEKTTLDVSALSAGSYVVQVFDEASKKHFSQVVIVE